MIWRREVVSAAVVAAGLSDQAATQGRQQPMASTGRAVDLPRWDRGKQDVVASADVQHDFRASSSRQPQVLGALARFALERHRVNGLEHPDSARSSVQEELLALPLRQCHEHRQTHVAVDLWTRQLQQHLVSDRRKVVVEELLVE